MKVPRLSVAIPVYNEEQNIVHLLRTIISEWSPNYELFEIIVVSDGSTDNTVRLVSELAEQYPVIKLYVDTKRRGKVSRLNQIYGLFHGDLLCIFDGDIAIPHGTLSKLVDHLTKNLDTVLAAAHQIPLNMTTLVSRIIRVGYQIWDDTRLAIPGGDHIQNFYGAASIYRGDFARSLALPDSLTDERGYIYLRAKEKGSFSYLFDAPIYYWPVTTLSDFWRLSDRSFGKNQRLLVSHFKLDVKSIYRIPAKYKVKAIAKNFFRYPVLTPLALGINLVSRTFPARDKLYDQGMWEITQSTKKAIGENYG